jgi:hypothetical protein
VYLPCRIAATAPQPLARTLSARCGTLIINVLLPSLRRVGACTRSLTLTLCHVQMPKRRGTGSSLPLSGEIGELTVLSSKSGGRVAIFNFTTRYTESKGVKRPLTNRIVFDLDQVS